MVPWALPTADFDESKFTEDEYGKRLKRLFKPEFLNRIDETIVFESLSESDIRQIVMLLMDEISSRLGELGITVELTEAAADHIAKIGYDPSYGARPLRRVLQRKVENELSKRLAEQRDPDRRSYPGRFRCRG